ncbi:intermembrane phospholipid transport protein YdbH family protein [Roseospirillum parvum]|uniref:Dicarboxylate transport n=1 Tax=Roseospirillum parvum TaxID=83401 RepID=A0A1G7XKB5_9PROT|nr:YdbH domain-containing protein [Roseospirillum parvum]SDG84678.1 Dicarboxylate transport [Roseospirillum parvum]
MRLTRSRLMLLVAAVVVGLPLLGGLGLWAAWPVVLERLVAPAVVRQLEARGLGPAGLDGLAVTVRRQGEDWRATVRLARLSLFGGAITADGGIVRLDPWVAWEERRIESLHLKAVTVAADWDGSRLAVGGREVWRPGGGDGDSVLPELPLARGAVEALAATLTTPRGTFSADLAASLETAETLSLELSGTARGPGLSARVATTARLAGRVLPPADPGDLTAQAALTLTAEAVPVPGLSDALSGQLDLKVAMVDGALRLEMAPGRLAVAPLAPALAARLATALPGLPAPAAVSLELAPIRLTVSPAADGWRAEGDGAVRLKAGDWSAEAVLAGQGRLTGQPGLDLAPDSRLTLSGLPWRRLVGAWVPVPAPARPLLDGVARVEVGLTEPLAAGLDDDGPWAEGALSLDLVDRAGAPLVAARAAGRMLAGGRWALGRAEVALSPGAVAPDLPRGTLTLAEAAWAEGRLSGDLTADLALTRLDLAGGRITEPRLTLAAGLNDVTPSGTGRLRLERLEVAADSARLEDIVLAAPRLSLRGEVGRADPDGPLEMIAEALRGEVAGLTRGDIAGGPLVVTARGRGTDDALTLSRARLESGALTLPGARRLAPFAVALAGPARLSPDRLRLPLGAFDLKLDDPAGAITLGGAGLDVDWRPKGWQVSGDGLAVAHPMLAAEALALEASGDARGLDLRLAGRLPRLPLEPPGLADSANQRSPRRPYHITLSAERRAGQADRIDLTLADATDQPLARVAGTVVDLGGAFELDLEVPPLPLGRQPGQFPAPDLHTLIPRYVSALSGTLGLSGTLRGGLGEDGLDLVPDLIVTLADVEVRRGFLALSGVDGAVSLDGLLPPTTPPGQMVTAQVIEAGIPLPEARLTFHLAAPDSPGSPPRLALEGATVGLAGGSLTLAEPTTIPLDLSAGAVDLDVVSVDLGELSRLSQLDGLIASGALTGQLHLRLERGDVYLAPSHLKATEPGILRYRPDGPNPLALRGESLALLARALDNFHYQSLGLEVAGGVGRNSRVALHVNGANPDLYDGYPFEYNLSVEGELIDIARGGFASYDATERVRRALGEGTPPVAPESEPVAAPGAAPGAAPVSP